MKVIFKDYYQDTMWDKIYFTITKFEVHAKRPLTTRGVQSFVRRYIGSPSAVLKIDEANFSKYRRNGRGYLYIYDVMVGDVNVGSVFFDSYSSKFDLNLYIDLHDIGLNYGDYELPA